MSTSIRIGIFDDHPLLASGLQASLDTQPDFSVAFTAETREALQASLGQHELDVLVLDVVAPDVEGLELFRQLGNSHPELPLMAYTTLKSPVLVENLLALGVLGYVNKRQAVAEAQETVRQVASGQVAVPEQYRYLVKRPSQQPDPVELSPREVEIIRLILNGKLSKEIASELGISQKTVENHRHRLFRKLEVQNVAELMKKVLSLGYSME